MAMLDEEDVVMMSSELEEQVDIESFGKKNSISVSDFNCVLRLKNQDKLFGNFHSIEFDKSQYNYVIVPKSLTLSIHVSHIKQFLDLSNFSTRIVGIDYWSTPVWETSGRDDGLILGTKKTMTVDPINADRVLITLQLS